MADLSIGSEFAGHRIEAVAGRGGMGVVYRATHIALSRTVALKVIASDYAEDPDFRERFKRESQTAASLDQPHVLPIYHAGEEEGLLYITMRFVPDTDLRALIANRGKLEPKEAAEIVHQVAQALDAAHASGLVHRDVKPANILISSSNGKTHAYLTDFGLTKKTASGGGLTKTGMWVGTLDYVAPEQIQGQPVDGRTDVYALAAVLYQAITGKVPHEKDSDVAKMWAHINDPPPIASEVVPGLPSEFDEVIKRGMAVEPDQRYLSAGDLGRAALAASEHQVLSRAERSVAAGAAAPGGAVEAVPPRVPPTTASDQPSDETATVIPSEPGAPSQPPSTGADAAPPPSPPPPTAPAKEKSSRRGLLIGAGVVGALVIVGGVLAVAGVFGGGGDGDGGGGGSGGDSSGAAGEVVGEPIPVGESPEWIDSGDTGVLVANGADMTISVIDPETDEVQDVDAGGTPTQVTEGEGGIWTPNYDGAITRVDPLNLQPGRAIEVGGTFAVLAAGAGGVWVTDDKKDTVTEVDPQTERVVGSPISLDAEPIGIVTGASQSGSDAVYVVMRGSNTVQIIFPGDPKAYKWIETDSQPFGVDYVEESDLMWVGTEAEDGYEMTPYDPDAGTPGESVALPKSALFIDVGPNSIWVTSPTVGEVSAYDAETGEQIGDPIELDTQPQGLVIGDEHVWVTNDDGTVTKIEPSEEL